MVAMNKSIDVRAPSRHRDPYDMRRLTVSASVSACSRSSGESKRRRRKVPEYLRSGLPMPAVDSRLLAFDPGESRGRFSEQPHGCRATSL
jgi:hypothetical protein